MSIKTGIAIFALGSLSTCSFASLINASFEQPSLPQNTIGSSGITGWDINGSGGTGVWNIAGSSLWPLSAPNGVQIGYTYANFLAQQSTDVITVGLNTISAYGGRRSDGFASSFTMEFWAGGTESAGSITGGTILGTANYTAPAAPMGSFTFLSASYTAGVGDPNLGQLISVRFVNGGGAHISLDDVRITTQPVPEPASMAALGIGALALLRRKKKSA